MKHRNLIAATALVLATTVSAGALASEQPLLLAQATTTEEAPKAVEEEAKPEAEAADGDAAKPAENAQAEQPAKAKKKKAAKEQQAAEQEAPKQQPAADAEQPKADETAAEDPAKAEQPAEAKPAEEAKKPEKKKAKGKKKNAEAEADASGEQKAAEQPAENAEKPATAEQAEQPAENKEAEQAEEVKPAKPKKKKKEQAVAPAENKQAEQKEAEEQPAKQADTDKASDEDTAPKTGEARQQQPSGDGNAAAATAEGDAPAATEAPVVVEADRSAEEKAAAERAEKERRAEKRKRRRELIGAGVAGVAVGAVLQGVLGGKVVEDEGDRIVVERDGRYFVRKDENVLLRRNGVEVRTEELAQGRQRSTATRPNGVEIVTLRDRNGNILKRSKRFPNGDEIVLIDNQDLEEYAAPESLRLGELQLGIPLDEYVVETTRADRRAYREALLAEPVEEVEREYSLREVRDNRRLRAKLRRIDLDSINFNTGSATVTRSQIAKLDELGNTLASIIERKPDEVFLIEGHTDAVGSNLSNLTLSDRRAETVAQILIETYGVPPENLVTEGYGEQDLKIDTREASAENRRVTVRRITPLLRTASN